MTAQFLGTNLNEAVRKVYWRRELYMHGHERNTVTPNLAEALRSEIRLALEADGKPFDTNVARNVYNLAMAARDMCMAVTGNVKEAIAQIQDLNGPMETLDAPGTPDTQMQASETFGARLIRELLATLPRLTQSKVDDPKALVHALAEARKHNMTDVAEELEVKLFGRVMSGRSMSGKPIDGGFVIEHGSYEHGFSDGSSKAPHACSYDEYNDGYAAGIAHVSKFVVTADRVTSLPDTPPKDVLMWVAVPDDAPDHSITWHSTRDAMRLDGTSSIVSPELIITLCRKTLANHRISRTSQSSPRSPDISNDHLCVCCADPPLCEACKLDPDPRGGSACYDCRKIADVRVTL